MKSKILFLFFLLLVLFSDCRKYPEDPITMLFVPLQDRIQGDWKMYKILIDGSDASYLLNEPLMITKFRFEPSDPKDAINEGSIEISTNDGSIADDADCSYAFSYKNKNKSISIGCGYFGDSIVLHHIIPTKGPINDVSVNIPEWNILKLTKNEFRLEKFENQISYRVYLKR